MKAISVYPCGTAVSIKINKAKGVITAVLIKPGDFVSYGISYWNDKEHTITYLHDFEFTPEQSEQSKIGFK